MPQERTFTKGDKTTTTAVPTTATRLRGHGWKEVHPTSERPEPPADENTDNPAAGDVVAAGEQVGVVVDVSGTGHPSNERTTPVDPPSDQQAAKPSDVAKDKPARPSASKPAVESPTPDPSTK